VGRGRAPPVTNNGCSDLSIRRLASQLFDTSSHVSVVEEDASGQVGEHSLVSVGTQSHAPLEGAERPDDEGN
jgi:hypothetical protein